MAKEDVLPPTTPETRVETLAAMPEATAEPTDAPEATAEIAVLPDIAVDLEDAADASIIEIGSSIEVIDWEKDEGVE